MKNIKRVPGVDYRDLLVWPPHYDQVKELALIMARKRWPDVEIPAQNPAISMNSAHVLWVPCHNDDLPVIQLFINAVSLEYERGFDRKMLIDKIERELRWAAMRDKGNSV